MFRFGSRASVLGKLFDRCVHINARRSLASQVYGKPLGNGTGVARPTSIFTGPGLRFLTNSAPQESENIEQDGSSQGVRTRVLRSLESNVLNFNERSQRADRVDVNDFVKVFDGFTRAVEILSSNGFMNDMTVKNRLSFLSALLLRLCDDHMVDAPKKDREMLAGNMWTFLREKEIPLDITHYNHLIKCFNDNGTNFDPKVIINELKDMGLTPDRITYQRLIHHHCNRGDVDGASALLEVMKESSMDLSETIFSDLLIGYSKQENPPSPKEMFELMQSSGVEPGSSIYSAAIISEVDIMNRGIERGTIFKDLIREIRQKEIQFDPRELTSLIECLFNVKENNEDAAKFLDEILDFNFRPTVNKRGIYLALLKIGQYERVGKMFWDTQAINSRLTNDVLAYFRLIISSRSVPSDFIISELSKVVTSPDVTRILNTVWYQSAVVGDKRLIEKAIKMMGDLGPIKAHFYYPLLAQSRDQKEMMDVLKDVGPKMTPLDLIDALANWFFDRYPDSYTSLLNASGGINIENRVIVLAYLKHLLLTKRQDALLEFLKDEAQLKSIMGDGSSDDQLPKSLALEYERLIKSAMNSTKDTEFFGELAKACQSTGGSVDERALRPSVRKYLQENNFEKAMELFKEYHETYGLSVARFDLMDYCIKNKDQESLQKVMNITTQTLGTNYALYDLAECCLKNGKIDQARRIYSSPGFSPLFRRVYQTATRLAKLGLKKEIYEFIRLNEDFVTFDNEQLYLDVLEVYKSNSDTDGVLSLWHNMQENGTQASSKILRTMASILKRNNVDVPFRY